MADEPVRAALDEGVVVQHGRLVDQEPALLLYYPVYNYGVDVNVHGVQAGPLIEAADRLNALAQWSVVSRRVIVEQQPTSTP